jgi:hypothetical protein
MVADPMNTPLPPSKPDYQQRSEAPSLWFLVAGLAMVAVLVLVTVL